MIEISQHDLVARFEFASDRTAHRISERGHVKAEDHFVRVAAEEVSHCRTRARDHRVGISAGLVGTARVRVISAEIVMMASMTR